MSSKPFIECSIVVKDSELKLINKYAIYEPLNLDLNSPEVNRMVSETMSKFQSNVKDESPTVIVKTTMIYQ